MPTWIRFATSGTSRSEERVKAALAEVAFGSQPPVSGTSTDPGLVVFDAVSPDVLDLVRAASRGGLVRILAVGTSPEALEDPGPWPLLEAGASDVLIADDPRRLVAEVEARLSRWDEVESLVRTSLVRGSLVGRTPGWIALLRQIVEVGRFSDASVLVTGESGTGKGVVARLIHALDPRRDKGELVTLDCRTLDPTLSGSELFGYEPGAFEGATRHSPGALGAADRGTLFLDEVAELPPELRWELVRAIQEGRYRRVGSNDWRKTNARLICSTSEDVTEAEAGGSAAGDFYRRLTAWSCRLPPLRDHRRDIPAIAEHLLRRLRPESEDVGLDRAVAGFLANRDYPANVHDLEKLVRRIGIRHVGPGPVTVGAIPPDERLRLGPTDRSWHGESLERAIRRAVEAGASLKAIGEAARDTAIQIALSEEDGDVKRAAKRLGASTRTVASRTAVHPPAPRPTRAASAPRSIVALPESPVLEPEPRPGSRGIPDES